MHVSLVVSRCLLCFPLAAAALVGPSVAAEVAEWPEFRGPDAQGHVPYQGLPLSWSETQNVAWKSPVPGLGWSSPVIAGNQIWLTTAVDDGRSLRAMCFARDDGRVLLDVEVFQVDEPGKIHQKNSYASPTPIIEGDRIYIHFGLRGTACLDLEGNILWKHQDQEFNQRHGPAGSPVIYQDLLIFHCDGFDIQYVVALDKKTGRQRWRFDRPSQHAYSTPLLIQHDGQAQLISTGADATMALDPATGQEIWRCTYVGYSLIPRPVMGHGMVYLCTGYNTPNVVAVRLGGQGNVTQSHVAWSQVRGAPHSPSPLLIGNELYVVSDKGVATCLDALSGEVVWIKRIGGNFSASPVFADGRIYLTDEDGATTVIAPGRTFEELAQCRVEGRTFASLAAADHAFFLRTDTHLYRIEGK